MGRFDEKKFDHELDELELEKLDGETRVRYIMSQSMEQFNPDVLPSTFMYVSISGIVNSGMFKESAFVRLDYEIVSGKDWDLVEGYKKGHSQGATMNYLLGDKVTWNLPFNVMYRTLEITGWPKLVIKLESTEGDYKKFIKGYASCIFPVTPGTHRIKCHIFKPVTGIFLGQVYGDQVKEPGKGIDANMIISGKGRDATTVENMGYVYVDVNISLKNFDKFNISV